MLPTANKTTKVNDISNLKL